MINKNNNNFVLYYRRYPFNDTTGSSVATDYSGNGFHATAAGHTRPTFTGGSVILSKAQLQHLRIDPSFGPALQTASNYSFVVSVKFNTLERYTHLFEFGNRGESVAGHQVLRQVMWMHAVPTVQPHISSAATAAASATLLRTPAP